ncbi:MAG: hypothetical protein A3G80_13055 [Betaproteobacteria bacterium RIFCSPLOWO2_12_FULL_62_13b]|nr:MAG: hypothetical protein A3G80_13055 [Betaproteobacteria bacterium RIFCSPLOWO2_12_FULL_62_13b]
MTRAEVLAILQIKPQTLYAYVSRGLIRSVPQPDGRSSFYLRDDVERIKVKSAARAGFGAVAASAMRWGEPVFTTSITQITEAGPRYRNRLAVDLVRAHASFETVADFLWAGTWIDKPDGWSAPDTPAEVIAQLSLSTRLRAHPHVVQLLILAVGLLGVYHGSLRERTQSGTTPVLLARQAIWTMTGVFGFLGPRRRFVAMRSGKSVAAGLARALCINPTPATLGALDALLVLDVDHELTSSTFTARIAASGAADLHACIGAALNTHHSVVTGSRADSVEELLAPRSDSSTMIARVKNVLASAQRVPGFNHPFYPKGDPRAAMLIEIARDIGRSKRSVRALLETVELLQGEFGLRPSFELGSVMLCRALGLPPQTSSGLRSLARTAGWVAHAFEQRLAAFMIRPRAKYVGSGDAP